MEFNTEIRNSITGHAKNFGSKQEIADFLASQPDAADWHGHECLGALPNPTPAGEPIRLRFTDSTFLEHSTSFVLPEGVNAIPSTAAPDTQPAKPMEFLLGSSILPSTLNILDHEVQLGTIVAAAHAASGLTVEAWNELPEVDREKLLVEQVEAMKAGTAQEASQPPEHVHTFVDTIKGIVGR